MNAADECCKRCCEYAEPKKRDECAKPNIKRPQCVVLVRTSSRAVCSPPKDPFSVDFKDLEQRLQDPVVKVDLTSTNIHSP
jgi:hypothetical protein